MVRRQPGEMQDAILARLSRRTTSGRYIPAIDGLRFVAIMLVLVFHVSCVLDLVLGRRILNPPFGLLYMPPGAATPSLFAHSVAGMQIGVQVFFAVSGFVLSMPYISARARGTSRPALKPYYLRRITRIEPPYLVVLTLLFIGSLFAAAGPGFGHFAAGLIYMHGAVFGTLNPYNSVTWSLEVEIQFYVLVPMLAIALCAQERSARLMTCLIISMLAIIGQLAGLFGGSLFGYIQFFMVGWIVGDLYVNSWAMDPPQHPLWDLVTVVGWPLLLLGLTTGPTFEVVLAPWLILLLVVAAFCGPRTRGALSNRWVATTGGMCYSIYLTHYPVLIMMRGWVAHVAGLPYPVALFLASLITLPVVLVVGGALFITVERPCMDPNWARRFVERVRLRRAALSTEPS